MRFTITQLLLTAACLGVVLAAYQYGYFFVGAFQGIAFAAICALSLYLLVRSITTRGKFRHQKTILTSVIAFLLIVGISYLLAPKTDLTFFIYNRRVEMLTIAQLASVMTSDPRFVQLEFQYFDGPKINIKGTVQTKDDFRELHAQILHECTHVSSHWIWWDIRIIESNEVHRDYDYAIFGIPESERGIR